MTHPSHRRGRKTAILAAAGVTVVLTGLATTGPGWAASPTATATTVGHVAKDGAARSDSPMTSLTDKIKADPKSYGALAACLTDKGVEIQVGPAGAEQTMALKGINRSVVDACK